MRAFVLSALFALATTSGALAAPVIHVQDVWAAPSFSQNNGVVYFALHNPESKADALLSAEAATIAKVTELHTHTHDGDVMRMRKVERVPLPAGQEVRFVPGGLHVMLIGLKQPLRDGDRFPLTLTFRHAPAQTLEVPVSKAHLLRAIKSRKPSTQHHSH